MEPEIFKVATKFAYEANKLNARKEGCDLAINLRVATKPLRRQGRAKDYARSQFWDGSTHQYVPAASLGVLMDEVYRRLQFEDREALRVDEVQSRLVALPAPDARHDLDGRSTEGEMGRGPERRGDPGHLDNDMGM
jgi:hypothetical protein